MNLPIKNEWLADLLMGQRDQIAQFWIEDIRTEDIRGYEAITDEQLQKELPPTVDSMIDAFRTGDTEGPRKHSLGIIQRRLSNGLQLPDLQMSLHALETAVMRIVKGAHLSPEKEFEALQAASNLYYLVALIAAAVYEQLRTEQQKRFKTTYEFGITLSKNLDLDTILNIAVLQVAEHTNCDSVAIILAGSDGDQDELRAFYNLNDNVKGVIPDICESFDCGTDISGSDIRETTCSVPDIRVCEHLDPWSRLLTSSGYLSLECMPLMAKQRRLGSLMVLWSDVHYSTNAELEFRSAMTGHLTNALQNAILYEEAKGKRELGLLLESSRLFASSLDVQDVLYKIAQMATEAARADLAIVFAIDGRREPDTAYFVHGKATKAISRIVEAVVSEGEDNGFKCFGRNFVRGNARLYSSFADIPGRIGSLVGIEASGAVVPLREKGALLGVLFLVSLPPNAFAESDLLLVMGLADLASVAIENARLYEYERNIAETLQKSFLPSSLPIIEGYDAAAYYRPAMAEAEIGGDFYDVFKAGNGNIGVVIGDVSGKGLKAAIPTAMGRYIIRAYASENPLPSNVLSRFNRTFYENSPEGLFMTALYGTLDPTNNVLTYVSAGHDPPLLYSSAFGTVAEIETGGLCLGVIADAACMDNMIQLQPGDVLLLYTDGATDVKGNGNRLQVEGLKQLFLSSVNKSAEQIVTSVSNGILNYSHGALSDDVALVVLKRLNA